MLALLCKQLMREKELQPTRNCDHNGCLGRHSYNIHT